MNTNTVLVVVFSQCLAAMTAHGGNAANVGAPAAAPTFECIGVELPFTGDDDRDAYCDIQYRKSGTTQWKDGLRLYADHLTDRTGFRGSIVHLEPATEYAIRLNYVDPDGGSGQKEIAATTWSESFPTGETVRVNSQDSALEVQSGAPGAYRVYDGGVNKAVVDVNDAPCCLDITGKSFVILRNIAFRESDGHAIRIENSHHIVIEDCEILDWGRPGVYRIGQRPQLQHAAVQIESGEQIVVQHSHIHDPRGTACDWSTGHPVGPRGIFFRGPVRHSVFRYNRIAGNRDHYYQDIITGGSEGPDSDVDICGNEVSHTWDDGIEIEGSNINVRVWNNVVHSSFMGLASDNNDHTYYGPVYIWRNIFTDLFTAPGQPGNAFKLENEVGRGAIYLFSNTLLGDAKHVAPDRVITNGPVFNAIAYNNIFHAEGRAYSNNLREGSFFDFNGYSLTRDESNAGTRGDWERSGLFGHRFEYANSHGWDYYLKPGNAAIDAGVVIDNFADQFTGNAPDLGSCEEGSRTVRVGPHADAAAPQ